MKRSVVVRVDEKLLLQARHALGLDGLPPREVVEAALRRAVEGSGGSRIDAIDEALQRIVRLVTGIAERLDAIEARLESIEARLQQLGVEPAQQQHEQAQPPAGEQRLEQQRREKRGGISGFCSERPYDVVDLQRVRNPEGFLASARRRGLRVLWEEGASVAVLVCPGVTPEQLLEAARSDARLANALRELGYLYEPEPGRLEWVEEPQLG